MKSYDEIYFSTKGNQRRMARIINRTNHFFKSLATEFIDTVRERVANLPHSHLFFSILLVASIASNVIYPLYKQYVPRDDYAIYVYFAEAVSEGLNPYSIPSEYRSDTVPLFFDVGWTQPEPGVVRQVYADYPPLLMMINGFFFRLHNLKGLYALYLLLYSATIILYLIYIVSKKKESHIPEVNPLIFLLFFFFALNPLISRFWFSPIEDKSWFAFFMVLLLILRNKPFWVVITLGFFAAVKGLGIPIMAFYLLYQYVNFNLKPKQILYSGLAFGFMFALSHLLWIPDWINAYQWRAARQNFVGHNSLFVPLNNLGVYREYIPEVLTVIAFVLLAVLVVKHFVTLEEILLLPIVFSIIFNTEMNFDRLLVAIIAMLLVARHNSIIFISYFFAMIFILITGKTGAWITMWGWTFFLLLAIGSQILIRHQARTP